MPGPMLRQRSAPRTVWVVGAEDCAPAGSAAIAISDAINAKEMRLDIRGILTRAWWRLYPEIELHY